MAEYNNQSIDIDLEEIFNGLSENDQVEYLTDMFDNLPDGDSQKDVLETNLLLLDDEATIDIIVNAFGIMDDSNRQEAAERIADVMTPEQREALIEYIKEG
jgi:hypothetical protein